MLVTLKHVEIPLCRTLWHSHQVSPIYNGILALMDQTLHPWRLFWTRYTILGNEVELLVYGEIFNIILVINNTSTDEEAIYWINPSMNGGSF